MGSFFGSSYFGAGSGASGSVPSAADIAAAVWSDAATYAADTKGAGVAKANKLTVTDNGRAGAVLIYDATGEVVQPTTLPPPDSVSVSSETIEVSDN